MKERNQLTKEDFEEWLQYPQTKAFFEAVKEEQEIMLQFVIKSMDMDSLTQAKAIGIMSGLQKVMEFEYDDGTPRSAN